MNQFKTVAWVLLAAVTAWAGEPVQLLDIDPTGIEIRLQAFLVKKDKTHHLDVCKHPLKSGSDHCAVGDAISVSWAWSRYQDHMAYYYQQGAHSVAPDRAEKQATLQWTRKQFRDSFERATIEPRLKESLENILNSMVYSVEENDAAAQAAARKQEYEEVVGFFNDTTPARTVVRSAEPTKYEALLSPYTAYLERNICRCESSLVQGDLAFPRCLLRKGKDVLAWAPSTSGDCKTRSQCRQRRWFSDNALTAEIQFQSLIEGACRDYFHAGPSDRLVDP